MYIHLTGHINYNISQHSECKPKNKGSINNPSLSEGLNSHSSPKTLGLLHMTRDFWYKAQVRVPLLVHLSKISNG